MYARVKHSVSIGDGSMYFRVDALKVSRITVGMPLSMLRK